MTVSKTKARAAKEAADKGTEVPDSNAQVAKNKTKAHIMKVRTQGRQLNVRAYANDTAPILGVLADDTEVTVLAFRDDWTAIAYNNDVAYVMSYWLA